MKDSSDGEDSDVSVLEKAMEGRRLCVKDSSDGEDSDASGFSDSDFGSDDD